MATQLSALFISFLTNGILSFRKPDAKNTRAPVKTQNPFILLLYMNLMLFRTILAAFFLFSCAHIKAQSSIKVHGADINRIDKKGLKQGDWVFFDNKGNIKISCFYKNDSCSGPVCFYENTDTAFIKLPVEDDTEPFILFEKGNRYYGDFKRTGSTSLIETDTELDDSLIAKIKKYRSYELAPVFYFGQKKLVDYLSAGFTSTNITFNKPIFAVLTISGSGLIDKVEFPPEKNLLSASEEGELHWIYSRLPRWQPFFLKNNTQPVKIALSNNNTLSYF